MINPNTRGILHLCLGVLVFSLQDAIIKLISGSYPITQVVAMRSVVAVPILLALVHVEVGWRAIVSPQFWPLVARGAILFVSYTAYYLAFPALPLADAVALYFTVPLFVTALAGPVLGERSGWRVWLAIIVGFGGVLVMLQPGSGLFEWAALLSLVSALMYGTSMLMARRLGTSESASVMSFYQQWTFLVGALALGLLIHALAPGEMQHPSLRFLVRPWVMPTPLDALLMGSCGVVAAIGTLLLTSAYRITRANLVTSFEYTGVLWAPMWGFLFFAEVPRASTVVGALLIVGAGLVALRAAHR